MLCAFTGTHIDTYFVRQRNKTCGGGAEIDEKSTSVAQWGGAQVCADRNKPDGQFVLPGQIEAVNRFMRDLPIRKVPGIGKVLCTATPCPRRSTPSVNNHTGPIGPLEPFTGNGSSSAALSRSGMPRNAQD